MQPKNLKIAKSTPSLAKFKKLLIAKPDIKHGYLRHIDINMYLEYVARRYSDFVTLHTLGVTYEQRPLKGIEIDWCCAHNLLAQANLHKRKNATSVEVLVPTNRRNIVFIEGGTHAREWMTISVALNCIFQLTEKNIRNRELLKKLRFFIVPIVNPDGYEYTLQKNRHWRKNRRPNENSKSIGTDCNRNYDFHWEKGPSKAHRCTYKGDTPFSEPETQAVRNFLHKLGPQMLFFLSLHSFAQSIMYPWGYSKELPETWPYLQMLARAGRDAIKRQTGRTYRCGSISSITKRCITGSIVDYAFGIVKVPLALVMELPSSEYGFHPPAEMIVSTGNETWIGIREMCKVASEQASIVAPTFGDDNEVLRIVQTKPQPKAKPVPATPTTKTTVSSPPPPQSIKRRVRLRELGEIRRVERIEELQPTGELTKV